MPGTGIISVNKADKNSSLVGGKERERDGERGWGEGSGVGGERDDLNSTRDSTWQILCSACPQTQDTPPFSGYFDLVRVHSALWLKANLMFSRTIWTLHEKRTFPPQMRLIYMYYFVPFFFT